jgi:flagellar basal body-associated protein FliL
MMPMAEAAAAQPAAKRNTMTMTLVIVLVVAVVEGAGFFAAVKLLGGGPKPSFGGPDGKHVAEPVPPPEEPASTEVVLLQRFKVPNNKGGSAYIYDFDISVVVPASRKTQMEELAKSRAAEISDRVAQIIRQAGPRVLGEDDFGTLRMQLRGALSEIVKDDQMIQRVLIPRCVPLPTE